MAKNKQVDLEELLTQQNHTAASRPKKKLPQGELTDIHGVVFEAKARNHYEINDGVPVAQPLSLNRPTIRQRIENLLNRDPDVLQRYLREGPPDGEEGTSMDIPDDPEAPLTAGEASYLDSVAETMAEAAPLPDEGLPRNRELDPSDGPSSNPPEAGKPQDTPAPDARQGADNGSQTKQASPPGGGGKPAAQAPAPSTVRTR